MDFTPTGGDLLQQPLNRHITKLYDYDCYRGSKQNNLDKSVPNLFQGINLLKDFMNTYKC